MFPKNETSLDLEVLEARAQADAGHPPAPMFGSREPNKPAEDEHPAPADATDRSPNQETVQSIHVAGVTYELRLVNCGKANCRRCNIDGRSAPSHGPYWYIRFTEKGKTRRVYMGRDLDTRKYRDAAGAITLEGIRRDRAQDPGNGHPTTPVGDTQAETMAIPEDPSTEPEGSRLARRRRLLAAENAHMSSPSSFWANLRDRLRHPQNA